MTRDFSSAVALESSKTWQQACGLGLRFGSRLAAWGNSVAFRKDEEFGEYADIALQRLVRSLVLGLLVACQVALLMLDLREGMVDIFSFDHVRSGVYSVVTVAIMLFIAPVGRYVMHATGLLSFAQTLHATFETKEDALEQQNYQKSSLGNERCIECTCHAKLHAESVKPLVQQPQSVWGGEQTAAELMDILDLDLLSGILDFFAGPLFVLTQHP